MNRRTFDPFLMLLVNPADPLAWNPKVSWWRKILGGFIL